MPATTSAFWLIALSLLAVGCGGEPEAVAPVGRESAEDQVLRVATWWESQQEERGFRSPPSAVSLFEAKIKSTLVFERGQRSAAEKVEFDESFKTTTGATYRCHEETKVTTAVSFGEHAEAAAVQLSRPAIRIARKCDAAGFPEPTLEVPASAARFTLRGDQLVAFAPTTESRVYLPVQ